SGLEIIREQHDLNPELPILVISVFGDEKSVIQANDGCGMAEAAGSSAGGMGLKNMRSRAALLGGEVCVSPQSDGPGTVVRLAVPVGKV
ncbi:MAG: hypothetical protein RIC89_13930, partial [Pseudomonadales bacterium]